MAMNTGGAIPGGDAGRLSSTLRLLGVGKLVLAVLTLILAFTGYDTNRALNMTHLIIGLNLLMLGWVCLALGKSFGLASGTPAPPALQDALRRANTLFGYYLILIALAVVGVGIDTVMFMAKLVSR